MSASPAFAGRLRALADAAERWRDGDFPPRVRALAGVVTRTGYHDAVAEFALDALFDEIRPRTLTAALEACGDVAATVAAGRVAIVASATTIGVALFPAVAALLAGCEVVVKDRSDDLLAAFRETLVAEDPAFASLLAVERWESHDDPRARTALGGADVVAAFGGDDALAAIRAHVRPTARFVPFGPKTSAVVLEAEALAVDDAALARLAAGIARDVLLYDGDGCLSPHEVVLVGADDAACARFDRAFVRALDDAAVEFPPSPRARANVRASAASQAFRDVAASEGPRASRTTRHLEDAYLLFVEPRDDAPPPLGPGLVARRRVATLDDVRAHVAQHRIPLEAIATAPATAAAIRTLFAPLGLGRVCAPGDLQRPRFAEAHGGHGRLAPFVRAFAAA